MTGTQEMTLNECFDRLLQMSDEDIKNIENYRTVAELSKDFSKPKVNNSFQEELERVTQPGYVSFQKTGVYDETGFKNQKP